MVSRYGAYIFVAGIYYGFIDFHIDFGYYISIYNFSFIISRYAAYHHIPFVFHHYNADFGGDIAVNDNVIGAVITRQASHIQNIVRIVLANDVDFGFAASVNLDFSVFYIFYTQIKVADNPVVVTDKSHISRKIRHYRCIIYGMAVAVKNARKRRIGVRSYGRPVGFKSNVRRQYIAAFGISSDNFKILIA